MRPLFKHSANRPASCSCSAGWRLEPPPPCPYSSGIYVLTKAAWGEFKCQVDKLTPRGACRYAGISQSLQSPRRVFRNIGRLHVDLSGIEGTGQGLGFYGQAGLGSFVCVASRHRQLGDFLYHCYKCSTEAEYTAPSVLWSMHLECMLIAKGPTNPSVFKVMPGHRLAYTCSWAVARRRSCTQR